MPVSEQTGCEDNSLSWKTRASILFVIGLAVIVLGVVIVSVAAFLSGGGSTGFGVVIFIGPVPIVLGAGSDPIWLVSVGVILAALSVVLFLVMRRRVWKNE